VPSHHRQPAIPVPTGGIETAHGVVKGFVLSRESRPRSQYSLEEAQGVGVITGELLQLDMLDPAKHGF